LAQSLPDLPLHFLFVIIAATPKIISLLYLLYRNPKLFTNSQKQLFLNVSIIAPNPPSEHTAHDGIYKQDQPLAIFHPTLLATPLTT
jgi:hypothetical protein